MPSAKDAVMEVVRSLPDDCSLEDIQYHLHVRQKIDRGLEALAAGRVLSQEEVEKRLSRWLAP